MSDPIPPWTRKAAQALYDQMERIDGEAMNDAQVAQDSEEGRFTWTNEVAKVIATEAAEVIAGHRALEIAAIMLMRRLPRDDQARLKAAKVVAKHGDPLGILRSTS